MPQDRCVLPIETPFHSISKIAGGSDSFQSSGPVRYRCTVGPTADDLVGVSATTRDLQEVSGIANPAIWLITRPSGGRGRRWPDPRPPAARRREASRCRASRPCRGTPVRSMPSRCCRNWRSPRRHQGAHQQLALWSGGACAAADSTTRGPAGVSVTLPRVGPACCRSSGRSGPGPPRRHEITRMLARSKPREQAASTARMRSRVSSSPGRRPRGHRRASIVMRSLDGRRHLSDGRCVECSLCEHMRATAASSIDDADVAAWQGSPPCCGTRTSNTFAQSSACTARAGPIHDVPFAALRHEAINRTARAATGPLARLLHVVGW